MDDSWRAVTEKQITASGSCGVCFRKPGQLHADHCAVPTPPRSKQVKLLDEVCWDWLLDDMMQETYRYITSGSADIQKKRGARKLLHAHQTILERHGLQWTPHQGITSPPHLNTSGGVGPSSPSSPERKNL